MIDIRAVLLVDDDGGIRRIGVPGVEQVCCLAVPAAGSGLEGLEQAMAGGLGPASRVNL